jgi:aspartate carbamoyltransferase catalytic subunit
MTIKEQFGSFQGLKVLIVGDIAHSRVAHSNRDAMQRLGMEVYFAGPEEFRVPELKYVDFDEYISKVDVVNMLRIQNERLTSKMSMSTQTYNKLYGLNKIRVDQMKPKSIIIHPAPFNRNVEINDDVVECHKSKIFPQIQNGVFIRMAMLL